MFNEIKTGAANHMPGGQLPPLPLQRPDFLFNVVESNQSFMGNLLYIIAVILIIGWAIGFLGYAAGGLIHILLVIAIILFLVKLIGGSSRV